MCLCTYFPLSVCVHLSVYLPVCLSVCLSVCVTVYLPACLFVCLSICLSVCPMLYSSVCVGLPVFTPSCLSLPLFFSGERERQTDRQTDRHRQRDRESVREGERERERAPPTRSVSLLTAFSISVQRMWASHECVYTLKPDLSHTNTTQRFAALVGEFQEHSQGRVSQKIVHKVARAFFVLFCF